MPRTLYPLAVDLRGKPVLVAGGGPVAARKLTELLRCGADITVVAPHPAPSVTRLASALLLEQRPFREGDETGRYLVFACTGDAAVNARIAELCRRGNILCNVADASAEGSFHVPGVIRKGDVTVTVSTGGAAPGLTRYLKSLLSDTLGEATADLAKVLGRFRSDLRSGPRTDRAPAILESLPYRALLEAMRTEGASAVERLLMDTLAAADAASAAADAADAADAAVDEAAAGSGKTASAGTIGSDVPSPTSGPGANRRPIPAVSLVGAGPGHPGLLTLLAAEAIRRAEVIVHDRLIPEETLHLAPPDCLLVPAGKRGHFESARQEDIQARMIEHARAGRRVVRLKGGDPFVYGRGWEEVLALQTAGIPWTVIPGVSSTTAGPAWAGIPLTHRGTARSYAVMSGMAYSETNTEIPKADTIVLVMGLHRLAEIVPAFLAKGWAAGTPAAAIQSATLPDQRVCRSTLAGIQAETARLGFDSPTLLVIGAVAGLSAEAVGARIHRRRTV